MKVYFGQLYIQPRVKFPFSVEFQKLLGSSVSSRIRSASAFEAKFGADWSLMIRICAKEGIDNNEIKGPTIFKKSKDVEFSIFLPFEVIGQEPDPLLAAILYLFKGIDSVLAELDIGMQSPLSGESGLMKALRDDPCMFKL